MLLEKDKEKTTEYELAVQEALKVLGKKNLALILHGVSFPSPKGQNTGFGTYNGEGGKQIIDFASGIWVLTEKQKQAMQVRIQAQFFHKIRCLLT